MRKRAWMYWLNPIYPACFQIESIFHNDTRKFVRRVTRTHEESKKTFSFDSKRLIPYLIEKEKTEYILSFATEAVIASDTEFISIFLESKYKKLVKKQLATLIDCAIDCDSTPEMKILLLNYRSENNLYREHKCEL